MGALRSCQRHPDDFFDRRHALHHLLQARTAQRLHAFLLPVSAARTEICAVSRSRVSPTRITSGSWRRKERSTIANVRPMPSLTWTWLTPLRLYSTGSSAVMMLWSGELIVEIAE